MRKKALASVAVIAAATFSLAACGSTDKPADKPAASTSTPMSTDARTGAFDGLNGKKVAGTAAIEDGKLVLSNYSSDEGPDLHIYLTNGTDEAAVAAGKQIAPVAFDTASQSFSLNGIDSHMYTTVVVHCDKAKAVFGAAALG